MKNITIIAHRGNFLPEGPIPKVMDRYSIPENTIEAFKGAIKNKWGIETDIRITGDDNFVVIHDGDIKRFSGTDGSIDQMDMNQIRKIGYKTNLKFKIPTLDQLCQLAYGSFIAFQIKRSNFESGVKIGRAVANKMKQYNLRDSILFDATVEEAWVLRKEFPWLNLSVSMGEENYSPTIYTPDQVLSKKFTSLYSGVWADEWKISGSIYSEELFKRIRSAYSGRLDVISPELHYNENHSLAQDLEKIKELWKKIVSWDIADGICTDYPTKLEAISE